MIDYIIFNFVWDVYNIVSKYYVILYIFVINYTTWTLTIF